jgi:hypothetical protein
MKLYNNGQRLAPELEPLTPTAILDFLGSSGSLCVLSFSVFCLFGCSFNGMTHQQTALVTYYTAYRPLYECYISL